MAAKSHNLNGLDRVIHSPARLTIVSVLAAAKSADFLFLLNETELTRGNLSTHLSKLEEAGYIDVEKTFRDKIPHTLYRLNADGLKAFNAYRAQLKRFIEESPN